MSLYDLDLSSLLNPPQLEAVETLNGALLILAGAGSGKTRVVIYRTLNLLSKGVSPKDILLLTFTNKAAREMKDRLNQLDDPFAIKGLTISTFHSLCVRILHREIHRLGFDPKFSIYNTADQKQVFFEVYKELKLDPAEMPDEDIRHQISLAKNQLISPADYPIKENIDKVIKAVYINYQKYLKHYNALDFDDLLYYTSKLFKDHSEVLTKYQKKFKYIMIDEYQDTNRSQYSIAKQLAGGHHNICVVGDDDQSIYSWRGADIRNILNFEQDFEQVKVIKLEENYRSTGYILKAANSIIRNNEKRKGKELFSIHEDGEKIQTLESEDPWDEAKKIGEEILLNRLKYNRNYRDVAILYRTNGQSKPIEETFNRLNIPFQMANKFDFYDRKEIKDALAYVKLINNPDDDLALLRIINFPKRGLGNETIKKLKDYALSSNISLFESMKYHLNSKNISINIINEIYDLINYVESFKADIDSKKMGAVFREFLEHIRFFDGLRHNKEDLNIIEKRLNNVNTLIENIDQYAKKSKSPSLKNYLTKLALFFNSEGKEENDFSENEVNLLTIHGAKGLEFPYVYIIGFEENYLPFLHSETQSMNLTEERRLCYVAMTRAQKALTLSLTKERTRMGEKYLTQPSRFLDEIPDEFISRCYGKYFLKNPDTKPKQQPAENLAKLSFKRIDELFNNPDKQD